MSKGFGNVQRKINQLFSDDPEGVFSTTDLCLEVYGPAAQCSKKQRVAVIRAAQAVAKKHPGIDSWKSEKLGGERLWLHHDNVMSYAIARTRSDLYSWHTNTNQEARKKLDDKGDRELIAPGGTWWLFVQQWIAERDHDQKRLAELKPALDQLEKENEAFTQALRRMVGQ